jgi:hypothetical protein
MSLLRDVSVTLRFLIPNVPALGVEAAVTWRSEADA